LTKSWNPLIRRAKTVIAQQTPVLAVVAQQIVGDVEQIVAASRRTGWPNAASWAGDMANRFQPLRADGHAAMGTPGAPGEPPSCPNTRCPQHCPYLGSTLDLY